MTWKMHVSLSDGGVGIIRKGASFHQSPDALEVRGTRHK